MRQYTVPSTITISANTINTIESIVNTINLKLDNTIRDQKIAKSPEETVSLLRDEDTLRDIKRYLLDARIQIVTRMTY